MVLSGSTGSFIVMILAYLKHLIMGTPIYHLNSLLKKNHNDAFGVDGMHSLEWHCKLLHLDKKKVLTPCRVQQYI